MPTDVNRKVERFSEFSLTDLLPMGGTLSISKSRRYLILVVDGHVIEASRLPYAEFLALMCLIENFPYYASREELLSVVNGGTIETCREQIEQAEADGDVHEATSPVINTISRLRKRLVPFGLTANAWLQMGYVLAARKKAISRSTHI